MKRLRLSLHALCILTTDTVHCFSISVVVHSSQPARVWQTQHVECVAVEQQAQCSQHELRAGLQQALNLGQQANPWHKQWQLQHQKKVD